MKDLDGNDNDHPRRVFDDNGNEVDPNWCPPTFASLVAKFLGHEAATAYVKGESTKAYMQRTDPVGHQHCKDAGRV